MQILSICNHKGGTGKTTTAIYTATALGLSGYRTLIVDLDPQGYLTDLLDAETHDEDRTVLSFFKGAGPPDDFPVLSFERFDFIPSSRSLKRYQRLLNDPSDVFRLRRTLRAVQGYDLIVVDTSPAFGVYNLNALAASRYVLIPVSPEPQPIEGAEQMVQTVLTASEMLNPDLEPPMLVLTQVDARKRAHDAYRHYLRRRYGDLVFKSFVRTSAALAERPRDGGTAFDRDPYPRGVVDYANVTDELLKRLDLRTPPRLQAGEPFITAGEPLITGIDIYTGEAMVDDPRVFLDRFMIGGIARPGVPTPLRFHPHAEMTGTVEPPVEAKGHEIDASVGSREEASAVPSVPATQAADKQSRKGDYDVEVGSIAAEIADVMKEVAEASTALADATESVIGLVDEAFPAFGEAGVPGGDESAEAGEDEVNDDIERVVDALMALPGGTWSPAERSHDRSEDGRGKTKASGAGYTLRKSFPAD